MQINNEVTAILLYFRLLFLLKRQKTVCHGRLKGKSTSSLVELRSLTDNGLKDNRQKTIEKRPSTTADLKTKDPLR